MGKPPPKSTDALRQAAQVERDGIAFFRRANKLAADPRVKFIFGRAAEEYESALKALAPFAKGKGKPKVPAIFPFEEYNRIECYVCGYESTAEEIPEVCPSCGAARYAFERELSQERAWDLVTRTTKDAIAFDKKASASVKDAKAKQALVRAAEIHKVLIDEAKEERARVAGVER
ncbi:MAG TPA: hypothetical protein VGR51_09660 [Thermoplasmata archaeon]|jgi:rubrerythrin|nr:hypothetical protein [Thermoplasmata archaeon]